MGRLWLRFFETTGYQGYRLAAVRSISFVARTQKLVTPALNTRGAIAGSYPMLGRYERLKYPNWATKFFADALLLLDRIEKGKESPLYQG